MDFSRRRTLFSLRPVKLTMFHSIFAVICLVMTMRLSKQCFKAGACIGVVSDPACNRSDWALHADLILSWVALQKIWTSLHHLQVFASSFQLSYHQDSPSVLFKLLCPLDTSRSPYIAINFPLASSSNPIGLPKNQCPHQAPPPAILSEHQNLQSSSTPSWAVTKN